jgi:hypothetical protein
MKMKYTVIVESSTYRLEIEVNKLLAEGWVLQGGVSTTTLEGGTHCAQALVLIEK